MIQKKHLEVLNSIIIESTPEIKSEKEYIELINVGSGNLFTCRLIYHIKQRKLFVKKIPNNFDDEIPKLYEREVSNYKKIHHLLIPKYYEYCIFIEFINGQTLLNIQRMKLTFNEKLKIVFTMKK